MNIPVLNIEGKTTSSLDLNGGIYDGAVNEDLFYEVVKMQLANRRSGTAATKTRAFVSGGGVKPWKQKGTGRARSGSNRSPVWRHGGTVFGPHPRDYSYLLPKRERKDAVKSALRLKAKDGSLKIFEDLNIAAPKTRDAVGIYKKAGVSSALVVVEGAEKDRNITLATRNLKGFKVVAAAGINVFDILNHESLVVTREALKKVEAMIS